MNDQNILRRHIKPAARSAWIVLRQLAVSAHWSHATWLVQAGADAKSVQGQMRHSRISTTMDIYAQIVPAGATPSARTALGVRKSGRGRFTVQNGPISLVF